MPTYTFSREMRGPYQPVLCVTQDGAPLAELKLYDKINHNFAVGKLKDWLGADNTSNIVVHGQSVLLSREQTINFDFSRFKP